MRAVKSKLPVTTTEALNAADGDGLAALIAAFTLARWQMIARGEIRPVPGEILPDELFQLAELV